VGAPADFGGRVLPNPRGIKPMLDTEIPPPETERISGGAKMNTDNAPLTNPKGDTSNPAKTQVIPQVPPEVQAAGQKEAGVQSVQQPAPEVKGTDAERTAIEHDKKMAMGSGNLVKLGTALLNERHLKPMTGEPKVYDDGGDVQLEDKDKTPPEFNQGYRPMVVETGKPAVQATPQHGVEDTGQLTPEQFNQGRNKGAALPSGTTDTATAPSGLNQGQHAMKQMLPPQETATPAAPAGGMRQMSTATPPSQDMYQATAGGALRPGTEPTGQGETKGQQRDLAKMEYKAKLADYDQRHQAALDEGTLEGKTKADYIAYAKQAFQSKNPYGSEGNHPGIGGKLLHGLARTGEIAADIAMPGLTQAIPGTPERMAREQRSTQANIQADQPMLTAQQAEEAKTPAAEGSLKEATQGGMIDPLHPELGPQQALYNDKTGKVEYKGQMPPKEGAANAPATAAQLADVDTRIKNNPSLTPVQQEQLQFPPNYKPTAKDVTERLANVKDIEDAARQGKQDEFNNGIRKLTEENTNLMTQAHLKEIEEKQQAADAKSAQNADVSTVGLYTQENYADAMKGWYKSGNFAKDSGLVTEIVNKEHSGQGAFGAATGGAVVGSLFGPEGTAVGAGVGAIAGLIAGPVNGYLDTLKKQGISDEGYAAMQAYFNTLPARFAYEVGVQGLSATALRSSQLIQKVLNTVPPPNTPERAFDNSWNQYYKPMARLTNGKIKLTAPKGYVPPTKEEIYPSKAKPEEAAASAVPEGAREQAQDPNTGKWYYHDGKGNVLGEVPETKK